MTPVEIFEYKQKWMASGDNNPVTYHSDYRRYATEWCKNRLHRTQWSQKIFTAVYEDTIFFEFKEDAEKFKNYLKKILSR